MTPLKNILIINPFGIGDVLFSTPLVANLHLAHPEARIVYLANRRAVEILRHNPFIDKVMIYERDEFVSQKPWVFLQKWLELMGEVEREKFDVVFDFSMNTTFNLMTMACGIRTRIGFDHRGRGRFLTHKFPLVGYEDQHVIEHYLTLLSAVNVPVVERHMVLHVPEADMVWASQWLAQNKIDRRKPLVAMIPGGGASWGAAAKNKRWPADKYADLADKIIAKYDAAIILMGGLGEEELCQSVAQGAHFPLYSAVGQTSVLQMAALLKQCRLAIVNDGGPLHIAVASAVKTLAIFGPVDPVIYGPYPAEGHSIVQKGLPCQPCYRRFRMAQCAHLSCLNFLSVDEVYRKVESIL